MIHNKRASCWGTAGRANLQAIADLIVAASGLGDPDEVLRWFLEIRGAWTLKAYLLHDAQWFETIRDRPEFQSWLRDSERLQAEYQREMAALGPWMPEEVLAAGSGS